MTGYDCVRESLDLFEASLGTGGATIRTVGELARRTGYSVYHFTRLFSALVGQAPKDYMSGRILSEAARGLVESDLPLGAVAEGAGFPDYETFSRAVKKRFGATPRRMRDSRALPLGLVARAEPLAAPGRDARSRGELARREPELVSLPAHTIAGLAFFIGAETKSFHAHWAAFMAVESRVAGRVDPPTFCQFSAWSAGEAPGGMAVLCGLLVDPGAAEEPLFTVRRVPAASYLRFVHEGDVSTLHETYLYIYRGWLASRDAKPLDCWEFQRYPRGEAATEIYIPVALA